MPCERTIPFRQIGLLNRARTSVLQGVKHQRAIVFSKRERDLTTRMSLLSQPWAPQEFLFIANRSLRSSQRAMRLWMSVAARRNIRFETPTRSLLASRFSGLAAMLRSRLLLRTRWNHFASR